jgi:hypothetical protein
MDIIGVDHLQFAVSDVNAGTRYLAGRGFELLFDQTGFDLVARSYYRATPGRMTYLRRGASRVELIEGSACQRRTIYIPIFDQFSSDRPRSELDLDELRMSWNDVMSCVCASANGTSPELNAVMVRADQPDHSASFWQSLGFQPTSCGEHWQVLAFADNLISMPLRILIVRVSERSSDMDKVDDLGCSSIALLTRNLAADREHLIHMHPPSEIARLRINDRPLSICFVRGPSGELVELIEPGRS